MDAVAVDPLAELLAAPEGKYEWAGGSLVEMAPPPSFSHGRQIVFLVEIMDAFAQRFDLGIVVADHFAQRLDETVRIPDVAFFKKSSLDRIKPTHSEGGADLVVEIVSPESRGRDRGDKYYEYERAGIEEYWIVDPERRSAEFYRLHDGLYAPVLPDAEGKSHSSALKGFFVRIEWLWKPPMLLDALRELSVL